MRAMAVVMAVWAAFTIHASWSEAEAASASGECAAPTATAFVSSDQTDSTASTSWVNVTDGRLNFTTAAAGCVTITFSGPAYANDGPGDDYNTLHVRTLLDGNTLCVPALYSDVFSQAQYPPPDTANSITRICKNIAAGAHNVQVQYRGDNASFAVVILSHVLTVAHR